MILYLGVFIIGFIAVSLWSFWLVIRPPRILIGTTPKDYNLPAEEVVIKTSDGLKLAGWFIPVFSASPVSPLAPNTSDREYWGVKVKKVKEVKEVKSEAKAIILLHGYPAEKADMLSIAKALHPAFATLLLDMRYFGKSQGRFTTLGLKERDDLKKAVDFLESRGFAPLEARTTGAADARGILPLTGFAKIGVFGFSLGGAVGIMSALEDPRIQAAAAYAPFSDLKTLGYESYSRLWLLKYPLVEFMRFWSRLFLGGDPTLVSPAKAGAKLSIPVLLIASRQDEQISFSHAEVLKQALAGNPKSEFYFFDRGLHGELPPDFEDRLMKFFRKTLGD